MPNIKSVVKDVAKSRKNHERNISAKSAVKTFVKKAKSAIESGDAAAIRAVYDRFPRGKLPQMRAMFSCRIATVCGRPWRARVRW